MKPAPIRKSAWENWMVSIILGLLIAQSVTQCQRTLAASPSDPQTLTNAAQILQLTPEQAKANLPVQIQGIVTCYDHARVLFVQDETAGIFLYHTGERLPIRPGQSVQVTGWAKQGNYSPYIDSPTIKYLEIAPTTLHPQTATCAQVQHGSLDAQWVEITGTVRSQQFTDNRLMLTLADPPHRVRVWISNPALAPDTSGQPRIESMGWAGQSQTPHSPSTPSPKGTSEGEVWRGRGRQSLPGSRVRVRGVVGSYLNAQGQLEGFHLYANSTADIAILRPPTSDPFSAPHHLIRDLATQATRNGANELVRVRGIVTFRQSAHTVFIQDATGGLEVQTQSPLTELSPGTIVEAAGYPGPILQPPLLEDALIRHLQTNAAPQPMRLSASDLLQNRYHNQLIEIEGLLLGQAYTPSNTIALAVQVNNLHLTALLDATSPRAEPILPDLEPRSTIRLTGVCSRSAGLRGTASGNEPTLALLLRSPADVKVIGSSSSSRTFGFPILAAATILTGAGLVWALWFIQKQRRQTEHVLQLHSNLQAEMRQSAQQLRRSVEERERIGRDLHDDIIQSIYAAGLSLEDCRRMIGHSPEQAEVRLAAAIHTLNNTIHGVRGFIAGLEPKVLNGREFKTALKSLALTSGDSPTQFQFQVDPAAANLLTSAQATELLHIAKEAMSNSLRHAHASGVTVSLQTASNGVRLEILDDGVGFVPGAVGGSGQGLRNMAARAREIGGELQTSSSPGQGCRILVTVPRGTPDEPD